MPDFIFTDYPVLSDGVIELFLKDKEPGGRWQGRMKLVPAYHFAIRLPGKSEKIGRVSLRVGNTPHMINYGGHIGYAIDESYRGHRYAAKACELVKQVALDHGMDKLWITCNHDNIASRRTCEIIGCKLINIVDISPRTEAVQKGERRMCRYRWYLKKQSRLE